MREEIINKIIECTTDGEMDYNELIELALCNEAELVSKLIELLEFYRSEYNNN